MSGTIIRTSVLIYTQDTDSCGGFKPLLERTNTQVTVASTSEELKASYKLPLSLVIMDAAMPDWKKILTSGHLRDRCSTTIPVIVITDADDEQTAIESLHLGAKDYIVRKSNPLLQVAKINAHLEYGYLLSRLETQNKLLEKIAAIDELTQLFNRRAITRALENELEGTHREYYPLGLMLIDMDHFKNVNDTYGHDGGDDVLVQFASLMQNTFRICDSLARYGGEEFCVVLPNISSPSLYAVAERLRESTLHHSFESRGRSIRCTVSIGAAFLPAGTTTTSRQMLRCADAELYEAKRQGRNRTSVRDMTDCDLSGKNGAEYNDRGSRKTD